jgi:NADH:ubiquinone oxidoreductase subunit 4 (subunit M)
MTDIRLVIGALTLALVLAVVGIIYLAAQALGIPDVLQNIAVGSLTALAGVLTGRAAGGGRRRA